MIALVAVSLVMSVLACGVFGEPTKTGEEAQEEPITAIESTIEGGGGVASGKAPKVEETEESPDPSLEPSREPSPMPTGLAAFQMGDVIPIGNLRMVVLGWTEPVGDAIFKPQDGNKFIAVELILVNAGDSVESVSTLMQMTLEDEAGHEYNEDLMASTAAKGVGPGGEIRPGERVRGKVGFQVPEDAGGFIFGFDPGWIGSDKTLVWIGSEPVALDPPEAIEGERAQEMFAVGDVVQVGEIKLTVHEVTFPEGDGVHVPQDGYQFVVVDVAIENTGSEAVRISSATLRLKDSSGKGYFSDDVATDAADGDPPDGDFAAGEKRRGLVGYQLPEDAEGLVLVFESPLLDEDRIFVSLEG